MRKRIIDWIFTLQSQRGILGEKERRLYTYAYGLLLNKIAIYAIIAIVGTITGNWIGMFSFLLPFTILRQYAGGIHLEKPMNCIIFSGFLVFGCGQYLAVASDIGKILCALWVAAILLIFVLAPIDTKGKKLDKTAKKIYGRRARGVLVIEVMIAICFWVCGFIVVKVPIQQLFQNGTIEQLCKVLGIEEHNGEKIDITDLQTAYLYGRKPEMILGGKGSRAYFSFEVEDVDIARLQKAIKNLVEEQEALRCTFHEDQYANVQESQEIDFTYYDLQILSSKEKDEKLEEIRKDLFERNFNINKGPLICFVATRIDDKKTIVHICHDGLVADGESHQIILKELENLYYGKQNASHCSFSEYTHYIKDMKENPEYSELLNEKVKRLSEFDTKPQLDALKDAKEVMKPNVGVVARIIPEDLYFKICEKGRENAVTPFSILLTAFGKALAKYSDNSKFLLNLPVSYRPMELEGVENLVGLCSNFILFGFDDSRSIGFLEQIEDNQNKLFSSREEGMLLSGTDVLKKVKQTKKEEIIAPVVFTSTVGGLRQGEAKFKKNMTLSYTSQVWLEGLLTEVPEGILFTLSYIKELFDEDVVNGIVDVFITILTMFGNKDKELFEMTDIPLAIRDSEIIKKLNDTTEISSSISFREKLKKNCEIYAEKYAFIDEQSHMTYQELNGCISCRNRNFNSI